MVIFSKMWCGNIQNKKIYRVFFGLVMMCAHSHRVNLRNHKPNKIVQSSR